MNSMENDLFIAKKTGIFTMRLFDTIMIPFVQIKINERVIN